MFVNFGWKKAIDEKYQKVMGSNWVSEQKSNIFSKLSNLSRDYQSNIKMGVKYV